MSTPNCRAPGVIRILLVDDHPMVREGLRSMLSTAADVEIVGEAGTAHEAITQAAALQPDVILLDIQLPDVDGLTALPQIKTVAPDTNVLMVTMHENASYVTQAVAAGAAGYILKGIRSRELIAAIHTVVTGDTIATPLLLSKQQRRTVAASQGTLPPTISEESTVLSAVERELLHLLAEGLSNKDISIRLSWSLSTVKKYVQRLFEKMEVSDRTRVVAEAIRRGLIS